MHETCKVTRRNASVAAFAAQLGAQVYTRHTVAVISYSLEAGLRRLVANRTRRVLVSRLLRLRRSGVPKSFAPNFSLTSPQKHSFHSVWCRICASGEMTKVLCFPSVAERRKEDAPPAPRRCVGSEMHWRTELICSSPLSSFSPVFSFAVVENHRSIAQTQKQAKHERSHHNFWESNRKTHGNVQANIRIWASAYILK